MARGKKAFPKYVEIYNEILELIMDGQYPEGSKLPAEDELSARMNVSRMTLRQALLFLKEDGVIESRHGSGNYVKKVLNREEIGIEEKGCIVRKACSPEITEFQFTQELTPVREYIHQLFKRKSSVSLNIRRYYKGGEEVLVYGLSTMLTDTLDRFELNLDDRDQMERFVETDLYQEAHRIRVEMKILPETQSVKQEAIQRLSKRS